MRNYKTLIANATTALVTIAAVVMVAIRASEYVGSGLKTTSVAHWREFAAGMERIGPADAVVTIVEFGDFQCPYCRLASADLAEIRLQFPRQVAIVFKNYPLPMHKSAVPAARAAECAAAQGGFEGYYNRLFSLGEWTADPDWMNVGKEARLVDLDAFRSCLSDASITARLTEDKAMGDELGVSGTPTFLINDQKLSGYPGQGKLVEMVRKALRAKTL